MSPIFDRTPSARMIWFPLAAVSFAIQLILVQFVSRSSVAGELMPVLLPASYLPLTLFLARNFSYWGMKLLLAGALLNLTVMLANGGLMPVDAASVHAVGRHEPGQLVIDEPVPGTKNVFRERQDVHLRTLSDHVLLPLPKPFVKAVSLGDVLIAAGAVIAFGELLRQSPRGVPASRRTAALATTSGAP